MISEENTYLADYYGMMRDIYAHKDQVDIIFTAILNEDVSFIFRRTGALDAAGKASLNAYVHNTKKLAAGLNYHTEAIALINQAVKQFMSDVIEDKLALPQTDYEFVGDRSYLKQMLQDEDLTFLWED